MASSAKRPDRFRHEDSIHAAEVAAEVKLRDHSQAIGNLPQLAFCRWAWVGATCESDAARSRPVYTVTRAKCQFPGREITRRTWSKSSRCRVRSVASRRCRSNAMKVPRRAVQSRSETGRPINTRPPAATSLHRLSAR